MDSGLESAWRLWLDEAGLESRLGDSVWVCRLGELQFRAGLVKAGLLTLVP